VVTWAEFVTAAPNIATKGKALLYRTGHGEAFLVTVRGDNPPQAHPISVSVVNGGLYAFILPSPKLRDLEQDGRYALHAHFDPKVPHEFLIRGRVRPVDNTRRAILAADWDWSVGNAPVFEFLVEDALYGERASVDDWPPKYAAWPGVTKGSD
jgi:dipeptidyl aminopeptidase/acylaminoacyl peptidase